jgi:hypothetical protein
MSNEVITYGKTIPMPLLQRLKNHMERIQAIGQRKSQVKEMQKVWEKIHSKREEK